MTPADDQFRDFFRSVTPTNFPPCPTPPAVVPSSLISESSQGEWTRRMVLALAASAVLILTFTMMPKDSRISSPNESTLLKDATADGKVLQGKLKVR